MNSSEIKPQAQKVLNAYELSKKAFYASRSDSELALRYLNNDQWSQENKDEAIANKKPYLTYNLIMQMILILVGNEQQVARRGKIKPRNTTKEWLDFAELVQMRWNAIVDEEELENKLQITFIDRLVTRLGGWIERRFELNREGYLDFKYEVANNFMLHFDPELKGSDYKLEKLRWVVKESWEPLDFIASTYDIPSELLKSEESKNWWTQIAEYFKRITNSGYSSSPNYDKENDRYKILEMVERQSRRMNVVYDGRETLNLTDEDYNKLKREKGNQIQLIMSYADEYLHYTTIIPFFNNVVVRDEDVFREDREKINFGLFGGFCYQFNMQASEITSLVMLLKDVQDDINKHKSQVRDYITQMLAGAVFIHYMDEDIYKKMKRQGNQPNQYYLVRDMNNMPQRMTPGNMPPEYLTNTENSVAFGERVSMINSAMKGISEKSGESGALFQQKVEKAAAALNPYYAQISSIRKFLLEDFVDNLKYVYSEKNRVVYGKDREGNLTEQVFNLQLGDEIINNLDNASFVVELDEGDDNITTKEDNFNKLLALVNIVAKINPELVDVRLLYDTAPIPEAKKMVEYIDQVLQTQSEIASQQRAISDTKALIENENLKREMLLKEEELRLQARKMDEEAKKKREKESKSKESR